MEASELAPSFLWGHEDEVTALAFSPDNKFVASGSDDQTLKKWNVQTGKLEREFGRFASAVSAVSFSPDAKQLAVGTWDGELFFWQPESGSQAWDLAAGSVRGLAAAGISICRMC